MRALVVDDSRAMRAVIRDILQRAKYQVLEAGSPDDGLEALRDFPPVELAVVDWNLPREGGPRFLRAVRDCRDHDAMWLLLTTVEDDPDAVFGALRGGADDCLLKPFRRDELLFKLARFQILRTRPS